MTEDGVVCPSSEMVRDTVPMQSNRMCDSGNAPNRFPRDMSETNRSVLENTAIERTYFYYRNLSGADFGECQHCRRHAGRVRTVIVPHAHRHRWPWPIVWFRNKQILISLRILTIPYTKMGCSEGHVVGQSTVIHVRACRRPSILYPRHAPTTAAQFVCIPSV